MAVTIDGTSGITTPALDSTAKFASADMPLGSVLQVVQGTYSTQVSSSSSTFADTGLTATITPTSASSKILVLVTQAGCGKETNNIALRLHLVRDASVIAHIERAGGSTGSTAANFFGACAVNYLDSPATTSAITYKTQFASSSSSAVVYVQTGSGGVSPSSTITLMEIAA